MAFDPDYRYEQISAKAYEHPADRAATSALHAVPLLDTVIKRLTDIGYERRYRQVLMADAIRLGDDQVPDVWRSHQHCAQVLDLPRVPDLYVTNAPVPNAVTIGARTPMVVVLSSLVDSYEIGEVHTVLAHEAGHVLSEHNYYTTALALLAEIISGALPRSLLMGLPIRALYLALLEWARAAELSADRAAAVVMADPLQPCRLLMRMAGGALPGMSFDAFVRQATEYQEEDDLFSRHARFSAELNQSHPFAVRRVAELVRWVHSGGYDRIRSGDYPRRGEEPEASAELTAAVDHYRGRFTLFLDRTVGDVQRMTRQFADWLTRRPPGSDDDGGPSDPSGDGHDGEATDEELIGDWHG